MATTQDYLNLISQYESSNRNVFQTLVSPSVSTAQGYYQITNTNWNNVAPLLGIDTSVYPTAMSAPQSVQAQVATYLLTQTPAGISNWSSYNPQLAAALSAAGMQTSGTITDYGITASVSSTGGDMPIIDVSGNAASTPTADLLSQLEQSSISITPDLSVSPLEIALAVGVGAIALLALR